VWLVSASKDAVVLWDVHAACAAARATGEHWADTPTAVLSRAQVCVCADTTPYTLHPLKRRL